MYYEYPRVNFYPESDLKKLLIQSISQITPKSERHRVEPQYIAKAKRTQVAEATFRDIYIYVMKNYTGGKCLGGWPRLAKTESHSFYA